MLITAYNASLSFQISQSYAQVEVPEQEVSTNDLAPAAVEPVPTEDEGKQKLRGENGVLRLLQEGHFKGNAEMRLREIFHRELVILGAADPLAEEADISPEAE